MNRSCFLSVPGLLTLWLLLCSNALRAQDASRGCTDPQALNYQPDAVYGDGSCRYSATSYQPERLFKLPKALKEVSGMVYWKGYIVALNDGGNPAWLHLVDTGTGKVKQVVILDGAANADWEDITQDSTHFYIGDFGNNTAGNRTNLQIIKVPKAAIGAGDTVRVAAEAMESIRFAYANQHDFSPQAPNSTRFDCEAMVWLDGQLHLFSKNWQGGYSVHYTLPDQPGNHLAQQLDSLDTGGYLITGADVAGPGRLAFTGYTKNGRCAMMLVFGFEDPRQMFDQANKRLIQLPGVLSTGHLESICFYNPSAGWLASEAFKKGKLKKKQQLMRLNWEEWGRPGIYPVQR